MSAQPIPASPVMHASASIESVRPPSNDERRAHWAIRYFAAGWHRTPQKPRIKVTVPQPRAASAPLAESASPGASPDARSLAYEYAADECASACSPDYWAEAPASYQEIRG